MHTYQRAISMIPDVDFTTDRAQAPLLGFVLAAACSATLWVTVGCVLWALLS